MDYNAELFNRWILSLLEEAGGQTLRCEETEYLEHVLRHHSPKREYTVSLLNNQNVKKIVPLQPVELSLKLACTPQRVWTTIGTPVQWEQEEELLHITLEKLELFDVIHIDY